MTSRSTRATSEEARIGRYAVHFPDGEAGDRVVAEIRARAGLRGLEGALVQKLRLERDGPRPRDIMGVLDGRIELAAVPLGHAGWRLLVGCERAQRRVLVLGVEAEPVGRRRIEAAARHGYGLALAPVEWIDGGRT